MEGEMKLIIDRIDLFIGMSRVPRARGRTCEASAILTANLRPDLCALELNTNALNCTFPEHATLFTSGTVLFCGFHSLDGI